MSRKLITKAEKKPKVAIEEHKEEDVQQFEFGTIVLTCGCGHKQELMKHIEYGIQFIIATNNKTGLTLHCEKCHNELRLSCEEGTPPPEPEQSVPATVPADQPMTETINEDIPQDNKEGESL